ncbi:hypothetical protein AB4156_32495 [Cupriavidus sp. 2MCAB6]|uniref:hypothetical protein n=1 Tax=Cupriavidus sp. 2MCAB6 TaxID=3232981 RepID=UPI003F8ED5D7
MKNTLQKILWAAQGITAPWIMLLPLVILKLLGFNVTKKYFYAVSALCLLWMLEISAWYLYAWIKTRQIERKKKIDRQKP